MAISGNIVTVKTRELANSLRDSTVSGVLTVPGRSSLLLAAEFDALSISYDHFMRARVGRAGHALQTLMETQHGFESEP